MPHHRRIDQLTSEREKAWYEALDKIIALQGRLVLLRRESKSLQLHETRAELKNWEGTEQRVREELAALMSERSGRVLKDIEAELENIKAARLGA